MLNSKTSIAGLFDIFNANPDWGGRLIDAWGDQTRCPEDGYGEVYEQ